MATNYGAILGIQNRWAPILFAVLYFLLMLWYLAQAVRRHGWTYGALALFSALRVISFSIRAAIASNHHNSAFNRSLAVAYEVLYNISFFSLLLSVNRLIHDRRRLAKLNQARDKGRGSLHRTMAGFHKGRIIELLMLLAVILGAVGVPMALRTNVGRTKVGNKLNDASTYIFLVATVFLVLLTLSLIRFERVVRRGMTTASPATAAPPAVGSMAHHLLLLLVAILILLRTLYFAVTVHQRARGQPTPASQATSSVKQTAQTNEHLWYPLAALAELLVVLLFLVPGIVPLRSLLARHRRDNAYPNEKAPPGAGYAAGDTAVAAGMNGPGGVNGTGGMHGVGAAGTTHDGLNAV
ncbi:hypothetical protein C8F01DRAFT_1231369 [Mycena amicta]|nr:hypothetical protein C8F01DRAFT_1231369 [Mycena amicta]